MKIDGTATGKLLHTAASEAAGQLDFYDSIESGGCRCYYGVSCGLTLGGGEAYIAAGVQLYGKCEPYWSLARSVFARSQARLLSPAKTLTNN